MPNGVGLLQHRCDTYVSGGRCDIGVKQRFRQTLELKIRTGLAEPAWVADDVHGNADDVHGNIETWRRWSPADRLLSLADDTIWVDIEKTIVKRRFGTDGQPRLLSEATRTMSGAGCDAEIAALSVNGREAWTLAFASFGHPDTHRNSLRTAWRSLNMRQAPATRLQLGLGNSFGYPEWISKVLSAATPSPGRSASHLRLQPL
jgi:hypothetical protein